MKAKVITYAKDGNTVVEAYRELIRLSDKVHYFTKDNGGNSNYSWHNLVFEHKGVFVDTCQGFSDFELNRPELRDEFSKFADKYMERLEETMKEGGFIRLTDLRFLEAVGIDPAPYRKAREKSIIESERRRKEDAEKAAKAHEALERERREREAKELEAAETKYRNGKDISSEKFLDLCQKYGVNVHIRTKGTIRRNVAWFNRTVSVRLYGKTPDLKGCFNLIWALNDRLGIPTVSVKY